MTQVGLAIGYSRGGRFAQQVTGDWADEFVAGHDYAVVTGENLRDLHSIVEVVPVSGTTSIGST